MKKIFIIPQLLMFTTFLCIAQPDLQWLIMDGKGKLGTTPFNIGLSNNYPSSNVINSQTFSLSGVSHPNRNCYIKTKNDLFIIYTDGTFFLSRAKFDLTINRYNPDYFYPSINGILGDLTHNITIPQSKTVSYMYLANIYEGDDPPDLLRVQNTSQPNAQNYTLANTSISQIPVFGASTVSHLSNPRGVLSATHDITKNSDATLILNSDALDPGDTLFLGLYNLTQNQYLPGNFFDTVNIFGLPGGKSFSSFPGVAFHDKYVTFAQLQQGNRPPSIFLNLRATENCLPYFPGYPENSYLTSSEYVAVFTLKGPNGNVKGVTNEYLMDSHDPNYCKVESICLDTKGIQIVNYYIQFKNQSFVPANQLKVEFDLPLFFDTTCIHLLDVHAGTSRSYASFTTTQNKVTITYNPNAQVNTCSSEDTSNCIGWVKFCARVNNPKIDLRNVSNDLTLNNAIVNFNGTRNPINDFYDKIVYDPPKVRFRVYDSIDCKCPCIRFPFGKIVVLSSIGLALAYYVITRLKGKKGA